MNKNEPSEKPSFHLPSEEEKILTFWEKERIFERSLEERPSENPFVFYEGPPTANGKPAMHHVLGRTFKDAIPRYQTMRGKRVERKAGWDTHGLPVEIQVEKTLGISGKRQIENIVPGDVRASIAKFNDLCRESVWEYKDEWERLTKRMGFWLDLDHPYITFETSYIESVWWVIKQIWDKELLYEDFKVVPYCFRCGTALSSHEVAQGYDEVTDRSVYLKFPVIGKENTYLLAWTTTPWTLPGNVALAINPEVAYSIFEAETGEKYIFADARENAVFGNIGHQKQAISKAELLSLEYKPLFDIPALQGDTSYHVFAAPFVTTDDGTGIVHTAVMYGEEDFALGAEVGLPKHHTVDADGNFTDDVVGFAGRKAKDVKTESEIIDLLNQHGNILKEEACKHTYPFCWRCSSPLIYYAKRSWFIRMSSLREQLIDRNNGVEWVPKNLKDGRFGDWIREVKDWALSRDRYWGTPLPIWRCTSCGKQECFGSIQSLSERSMSTVPDDLHKPGIDEVKLSCAECDAAMERYPEVIDVWFDSGAMPFAQHHYPFENKSQMDTSDTLYPSDYIAEGIDQTRGWFYTLLAIATLLGRPAPYKVVVAYGHLLDKQGKKMSKSKGNVVNPWEMIEKFGMDPIRWYFYSVNQPGDTKKFDANEIDQVVRKTFLICWNMLSFLSLHESKQQEAVAERDSAYVLLDDWLRARSASVVQEVTKSLDAYDFFHATLAIRDYVNDLSTWYLRLSRKRTDAQFTTEFRIALRGLAGLFAPFAPFFAEMIWQKLRQKDDEISIHLTMWPRSVIDLDTSVLQSMAAVREIVEVGRAERSKASINARQPLVKADAIVRSQLSDGQIDLIKKELNVKHINVTVEERIESVEVTLDTTITAELQAEGMVRELTRAIQQLRKTAQLQPGDEAKILIWGEPSNMELVRAYLQVVGEATTTTIREEAIQGDGSVKVAGLTLSLLKV